MNQSKPQPTLGKGGERSAEGAERGLRQGERSEPCKEAHVESGELSSSSPIQLSGRKSYGYLRRDKHRRSK